MRKMLLIALLMTSACKKKDDAGDNKAMDKMADKAAPDPAAPPTPAAPDPANKATPPAPTGDSPIKSSEDFLAVNKKLNDAFVEALKQPDCDKAAAAIGVILTEHGAEMTGAKKWEDTHPDDKAKVEAGDKALADQMGPSIEKCKDNKPFQDVLAKLPN